MSARRALSFRQPLESRHSLRDLMEGLLVDGVDRHLRRAEQARVVERSDFQDHVGQAWPARGQVRAAFGTKLPRDRVLKIAAGKLLWRTLGVAKAIGRHQQKH